MTTLEALRREFGAELERLTGRELDLLTADLTALENEEDLDTDRAARLLCRRIGPGNLKGYARCLVAGALRRQELPS